MTPPPHVMAGSCVIGLMICGPAPGILKVGVRPATLKFWLDRVIAARSDPEPLSPVLATTIGGITVRVEGPYAALLTGVVTISPVNAPAANVVLYVPAAGGLRPN